MWIDGPARRLRRLLLAAVAVAGAGLVGWEPAAAQDRNLRPFATPLFWLNSTPDLRLPIRERNIYWFTGIAGPRPPAPKKAGLTPRLSFGVESRDQTLGIGGTDTIATLTPGLAYTKYARRWSLGADVTFDLSKHFDQEQFSFQDPNVIADAQFIYSLSPQDSLTALASYSRLRDTGDAVLDGVLPVNTVISRRDLSLAWSHRPARRTTVEFLVSNRHEAVDRPLQPDITVNTANALFGRAVTERDLIEAIAYFDHVQFENSGSDNVGSVFGRYTRDMGDRLAVSAELGGLSTTAAGGRSYPKFGAVVTHTAQNAKYEFRASRDIITIPGLRSLVRNDNVSVTGLIRFSRGLQLQALAERQLLKGLGPVPVDIQVNAAELALSYAASRNVWIWARLRESHRKSGQIRNNDTRVYIGVSRTFN